MNSVANPRHHLKPILSHEEETRLIHWWQTARDPRALQAIVSAFEPLIHKLIARTTKSPDIHRLVVSCGTLGIMRALETFDPSRGLRFATYARNWIWQQAIQDVAAEGAMVKLTYGGTLYRIAAKIRNSGIDIRDHAAVAAAGRAAGLSESEIVSVQTSFAASVSFDAPTKGDSGTSPINLVPGADDVERDVARRQGQEIAEALLREAMSALSEREIEILRARLMSDHSVKLRELGGRYGLSRERVRQLEAAALEKLRARIPKDKARQALEALAA